jgi:hypothetical protein
LCQGRRTEFVSGLLLGNRHALDKLLFRCAAESESCHVQLTEYWTYPFFPDGDQLPDTIHNTCAGGPVGKTLCFVVGEWGRCLNIESDRELLPNTLF